MKDDLAQKEKRVKELVAQHEALQEQLHSASEKARQQENRMRSLERQLSNLKVGPCLISALLDSSGG